MYFVTALCEIVNNELRSAIIINEKYVCQGEMSQRAVYASLLRMSRLLTSADMRPLSR